MTTELQKKYLRNRARQKNYISERADRNFAKFISVFLTVIILITAISSTFYVNGYADNPTIVVGKGETLWEIASSCKGDNDIRRVIDDIKKLNNLEDSALEFGQILKLPIY